MHFTEISEEGSLDPVPAHFLGTKLKKAKALDYFDRPQSKLQELLDYRQCKGQFAGCKSS